MKNHIPHLPYKPHKDLDRLTRRVSRLDSEYASQGQVKVFYVLLAIALGLILCVGVLPHAVEDAKAYEKAGWPVEDR